MKRSIAVDSIFSVVFVSPQEQTKNKCRIWMPEVSLRLAHNTWCSPNPTDRVLEHKATVYFCNRMSFTMFRIFVELCRKVIFLDPFAACQSRVTLMLRVSSHLRKGDAHCDSIVLSSLCLFLRLLLSLEPEDCHWKWCFLDDGRTCTFFPVSLLDMDTWRRMFFLSACFFPAIATRLTIQFS